MLPLVELDTARSCLRLPEGVCWVGSRALGSVLYVRDCYVLLADMILAAPEFFFFAVIGNPGTLHLSCLLGNFCSC